jgi:hypothetical protein
MGSVFDNLRSTYTDMFEGTVGGPAAAGGILPAVAAATARDAYENAPADATPQVRYAAAKAAVAAHLAPISPLAAPALAHMFDAVHAQPPAPVTPATSTAKSVSDAASKTTALALGSISGTLKLSGPSLLGSAARTWFGLISAALAGGSVYVIFRLADDSQSHTGTAIYIGLAVAIFMALLTLLLCVTGYSNVNIEGARGNSGKAS